jgi:hypothetical protein
LAKESVAVVIAAIPSYRRWYTASLGGIARPPRSQQSEGASPRLATGRVSEFESNIPGCETGTVAEGDAALQSTPWGRISVDFLRRGVGLSAGEIEDLGGP